MKVVLTGGGTMGSVSPLIAIYQELKRRDGEWEAVWIGTQDGPEFEVVKNLGITYFSLPTIKFRRYFSIKNLIDPFKLIYSISKSKKILSEFKPDIVLSAGSYVAFPVAKAAHKLKIPFFIHQQDIVKGLANKMMEKYASIITITYDSSLGDFNMDKTFYTSNPIRHDRLACDGENAVERFGLDPKRKTILIIGGGVGAQAINQLTLESLGVLTEKYQVVHQTGAGKSILHLIEDYYPREVQMEIHKHYFSYEFIDHGMCEIMKKSDIVVTRAGISSLTELSVLQKPIIIIPIPGTHQEKNAEYYAKYNAAKYLKQKALNSDLFTKEIVALIENNAEQTNMKRNIAKMIDINASQKYVDLIYKFLKI